MAVGEGYKELLGFKQAEAICHLGLAWSCPALPVGLELTPEGLGAGLPPSPCFCSR